VADDAASALAAGALLWAWGREDGWRRARWGLVAIAGWIVVGALYLLRGGLAADTAARDLRALGVPSGLAQALDVLALVLDVPTLVAIAASVRVATMPAGASARLRYHAAIALGFGLFPCYITSLGLAFPQSGTLDRVNALSLAYLSGGLAAAWLVAAGRQRSRAAVWTGNAFLVSGLAGLVVPLATGMRIQGIAADPGRGVVRSIEFAVLAWAFLSDAELGARLLSTTARRGTLAAVALAALFIVAQVAQNYFAAQYGLLLGGIVAGAFLFAASPLQRVAERYAIGSSPARMRVPVASASREGDPARAEEVYRDALRIALRNRTVTREEELHLAELGERLGLPARRALELRHEVEAETQP
jgi:hypothetical protein